MRPRFDHAIEASYSLAGPPVETKAGAQIRTVGSDWKLENVQGISRDSATSVLLSRLGLYSPMTRNSLLAVHKVFHPTYSIVCRLFTGRQQLYDKFCALDRLLITGE